STSTLKWIHGKPRADRAGRKSSARNQRTYHSASHSTSAKRIHVPDQICKTAVDQDCRGHATARHLLIGEPAADGIAGIGFPDGSTKTPHIRGSYGFHQTALRKNR